MTRTLDSCGLFPRPLCPAILVALLALAPAARGDLYVYQPFNYAPRSDIAVGSLSDPTGTLATSANRLQGTTSANWRVAPFETWGTPGTEMWASWLQRRDRNTQGFQGLNVMRPTPTGGAGLYFIGDPGFGPGDNKFVVGGGDDFTVVSSGVSVVPNETAFLVARFQFREGNDAVTLYVNPTPGAAEPTSGVTYSGRDMPVLQPYVAFDGFGAGIYHEFDEMRIGSTYASVAPAVPEPSAAVLFPMLALAAIRRGHRLPLVERDDTR